MVIVEAEGVQKPLLTVQTNWLLPTERAETADELLEEELMSADPREVQLPVPMAGAIAFKVAVVAQTVWLFPALAKEGFASL